MGAWLGSWIDEASVGETVESSTKNELGIDVGRRLGLPLDMALGSIGGV